MRRSGIAVAFALLAFAAPVVPAAPAPAAPAGSTQLVSRPDGLGPVPPAFDNASATPGAISADGRYAAFTSQADGFASGTNPAVQGIFLRDTQAGTTTLVSRSDGPLGIATSQTSSAPALAVAPAGVMPDAPAGQPHVLVAFETTSPNLVDHATGLAQPSGGQHQVWLRDVTAGTTHLVSRADGATGAVGNSFSGHASIDVGPAGPVIAFFSGASNFGYRGGGIFLRTFNAADTQLISCRGNNCSGTPTGASASNPDVRFVEPDNATLCTRVGHPTGCVLVAFETADTSITNDPGGQSQIAVALADAGTTNTGIPSSLFLESRPNGSGTLPGDRDSTEPSFNADGHAVAFLSEATNLTADALPTDPRQAYMRSMVGATTTLLSRADGAAGAVANGFVASVDLGGDAAHLRAAFIAVATNLGSSNAVDAFVRNPLAQTTELLNRAAGPAGAPGDAGASFDPAVSADGGSVLFGSAAHNLGDDPAPFARIHVRRLGSGAVELVSRPDGTGPFSSGIGQSSLSPGAVSDDARYVAFTSSSSYGGLAPGDRSSVFVRDVLTGRTTLVSRASGAGGAPADGDSFSATISGDGRFVAFDSTAGNLAPGVPPSPFEVYVRDLATQTTTLVSRANGATGSPATLLAGGSTISRDGSAVVFVTRSALDPAGADGFQHVYVRNLAAQTTTLVDRDDGAAGAVAASDGFEAVLDTDGSRVAWTTAAALAGAPADGRFHIFRRDLTSGRTVLTSRADGPAGASADRDSRSASIDADGDVIAFSSHASNFGVRPLNGQFYVRDVAGGHTQLVSRASGVAGALPNAIASATIDAAGDRVAFSAVGQFGDGADPATYEAYLRDLPTQTTTLVSRADGALGAPADGHSVFMAVDAAGGCVAFASSSTNLGDGFSSLDFDAVHMRALQGDCPHPAAAPPGPGPGPGLVVPISRPRVQLTRLKLRPRRFHVGGRRGGTRISFTLDRAARVTLAFDRLKQGHRVKRRCRARASRGRRCTIAARVGTLEVSGRRGANAVAFSGRLGRRALARGNYLLTATPAGGRGQSKRFSVVAAPRHRR